MDLPVIVVESLLNRVTAKLPYSPQTSQELAVTPGNKQQI